MIRDRALAVQRLRTVLAVCTGVQVVGLLFSIALSSIASVCALAAFIALAVVDPATTLRRNGLEPYILAFVAAIAISVTFAVHPLASLVDARRIVLYALVYFIPAAFVGDRTLARLVLVLAAATALQSAIEIVLLFAGPAERLGSFQHYMTSAGIKMLVLLLAVPQALDRGNTRRMRAVYAVCTALMLVALVLTQTRSSWIGFAAGLLVIGIAGYRSALGILAALVIAFALLALGPLHERITHMFSTQQGEVRSSTVASNQNRIRMWRTGWRMFLSDPLTGVGEGEMYHMYRTWVPDAHDDEGGHLHNTYIHILATHGLPGILAMLALFAVTMRAEWRAFRAAGRTPRGAIALGALAAMCAFLVNGMAEYNYGDHEIMVLVWAALGCALAVHAMQRAPETAER